MDLSIVAVEVAVRTTPGSPLRKWLQESLAGQPPQLDPTRKWQFYSSVSQALAQHLPYIDRACWDFYDETDKAKRDFKMWCDGMRNQEGARTSPSMDAVQGTQELRYLTYTMAFLVQTGSPSEQAMKARCDIPDERLWQRATIGYLLSGIPLLDFSQVVADVAYMIPGQDAWALTPSDLDAPTFSYLRALQ